MMETILPAAPLERLSQKERRRKALAGFSPRLHPGQRGREAERQRRQNIGDGTGETPPPSLPALNPPKSDHQIAAPVVMS